MTDLFNTKDLLTVATVEQAVIGTKGYFGNTLKDIKDRVERGEVFLLDCIENGNLSVYPFKRDFFEDHFALFLPKDKVKKPSYRPFNNIEELFDFIYPPKDDDVYNQTEKAQILVGKKIVLKDKINKRIRVMVIQSVEYSIDSNDNSNVYLNCFSLNELFNTYEIQINDEWVPFGIER